MSDRNHNFVFEEKWKVASKKMGKNVLGGFGIGICVSLLLWRIILLLLLLLFRKEIL